MIFRLVDFIFDVPGLSVTEHVILNAICRAASDDDNTCFPSKTWIAEKSRQSPRQVHRIIPNLGLGDASLCGLSRGGRRHV